MPKLKSESIQQSDLIEYLDSSSDFGFELSILKMLREKELECEHGGHYEDSVTGKSREFDIRALKTISNYRVRLAVECKNIREYFPILISCIPRRESESYHQIALLSDSRSNGIHYDVSAILSRARIVKLQGKYSMYKPNDFVGKSTVQVGRINDGSLFANDSELYDKWSQCLSSSNDLVARMYMDGYDEEIPFFSLVIPIVVVPNGRLWSTNYDDDGNIVSEPSQINRSSCFIDKIYEIGTEMTKSRIRISHVEIMTFDGLSSFVDSYLTEESDVTELFSKEGLLEAFD